jgi:hypothetical protein
VLCVQISVLCVSNNRFKDFIVSFDVLLVYILLFLWKCYWFIFYCFFWSVTILYFIVYFEVLLVYILLFLLKCYWFIFYCFFWSVTGLYFIVSFDVLLVYILLFLLKCYWFIFYAVGPVSIIFPRAFESIPK